MVNQIYDQQSDMDDDTTDENPLQQEQRPQQMKQVSKQSSKALLNKDLPLQRQASSGAAAPKTEKSRIAFLEQRNHHLELELKRHQVHLAQTDELHQKYRCLKIDYRQLLQSFERSEEIRREQKELINEQRQ